VTLAGRVSDSRFGAARLLAAAAVICAFAVLATSAHAVSHKAKFSVSLTGNGLYTNRTTDHVRKLNGLCNTTATERTSFSFSGVGVLDVSFSKKGMTGDSYTLTSGSGDWARPGASPTTLTKVSTGDGCNPPFGEDMSGKYDCNGAASPQSLGKSTFRLGAAGRGKQSNLKVTGPARFADTNLSGSWTYQTGRCKDLSGAPLLTTMDDRVSAFLGPRLSIPERKLRNLHTNEYILVNVGEGKHAPQVDDAAQCAANPGFDTCRQTFAWGGYLVVKRLS